MLFPFILFYFILRHCGYTQDLMSGKEITLLLSWCTYPGFSNYTNLFSYLFVYVSFVGHTCHGASLEVRGQLEGASSVFSLLGAGHQNQVIMLISKHLYPQSRLTSQVFLIPFSNRVLIVEPGLELVSCCCSFQNSLNYRTILLQTKAQRHQVIFLGLQGNI